ncbi:MAG TPA: CPBP family intramembrane glutamic endopeptidase [Anaerolineales bacterium]|nr:CPBP family intramembrane glutamic endopeptidase [Anaerolineales bacterium]
MKTNIDSRRILIFLGFAFGIAWAAGLVIYLTGGIVGSPLLAPNLTLALVLMATAYMWAPALGNLLTRLITREGWKDMGLRPNFRKGWPFWLAGWFLPALMTVAGAAVFFLIFPQYFDSSLSTVREAAARSPSLARMAPWMIIFLQLLAAAIISPIANSLATFGEEFGWRAYLLPKLMPLGGRKAMLLIGAIWGIWHWPVILMGYEYGFSYPGYPWAGPLLFLWVTFGLGIFLGWLTLRAKSVWPAVIGHAAINGIAGAAIMVMIGNPNRLVGPLPVGILGSVGFALVAIALFVWPKALEA